MTRWLPMVVVVALCARSAGAQVADTVRLDSVTVTGSRVEIARGSVPARVEVIDGAELRRTGVVHLAEALRAATGVHVVQTGSMGAVTSMFVRGGESDYVQVLIDGVPANEPGGAVDLGDLTVEAIDRVEILRGPGSVLYGSDAMTGVIQIFTRTGAQAPGVAATARMGSYGTRDLTAVAAGARGGADVAVTMRHVASDGLLDVNNAYRNTSVSGRAAVQLDPDTRASIVGRHTDAKFNFPTDGAGNIVDSNQYLADRITTVAVGIDRRLGARADLRVGLGLHAMAASGTDEPDGPGDSLGVFASRTQRELQRRQLDARVDVRPRAGWVVTLGATFEDERERSLSRYESSFGPFGGDVDEGRWNGGVYGQGLAEVGVASVQVGARLDRNQRYGSIATARGGVVLRPVAAGRVHVSIGNAFKAPTFLETFGGGFVAGNPDLRPERSLAFEAGAEYGLMGGAVRVAGTYFRQRFRDIVQYVPMPAAGEPNFLNVAAARTDGVEVEADVAVGSLGTLRAQYVWVASRVTDAGFAEGPDAEFVENRRLVRRPSYTMGLSGRLWLPADAVAGIDVQYVGSRDDLDFSSFPFRRVTLPSHVLVHLSTDWPLAFGGRLGLLLRVDNVFGVRYEDVRGFGARGRSVLVGMRARH